jgi:AcrR family transcriptional regulator
MLDPCIAREAAIVKGDAGHRRTQAERRAATRGALLAAARALFARRGFRATTREEVVERAGVTRGALYHHFSSKEALFEAVYEAVEADLCDAVIAASASGRDPVEQLRLGARAFLDAAATPEVRRIVLLDGPAVASPEFRREIGERYGLGLVRGSLGAADAAGRLAIGPVDELAPVVLAALHEAAIGLAEGRDPDAVRAVVAGLLDRLTTP